MWSGEHTLTKGIRRFFFIGLSHETLENYYRVNFQLVNELGYSLTELDYMMPWEREIYIAMLIASLEEKKQQREAQGH